MIRWTAPDLTAEERGHLAAINGLVWDRWGHADRREWERMLAATGKRRDRPKAEEKAAGLFEGESKTA